MLALSGTVASVVTRGPDENADAKDWVECRCEGLGFAKRNKPLLIKAAAALQYMQSLLFDSSTPQHTTPHHTPRAVLQHKDAGLHLHLGWTEPPLSIFLRSANNVGAVVEVSSFQQVRQFCAHLLCDCTLGWIRAFQPHHAQQRRVRDCCLRSESSNALRCVVASFNREAVQ